MHLGVSLKWPRMHAMAALADLCLKPSNPERAPSGLSCNCILTHHWIEHLLRPARVELSGRRFKFMPMPEGVIQHVYSRYDLPMNTGAESYHPTLSGRDCISKASCPHAIDAQIFGMGRTSITITLLDLEVCVHPKHAFSAKLLHGSAFAKAADHHGYVYTCARDLSKPSMRALI